MARRTHDTVRSAATRLSRTTKRWRSVPSTSPPCVPIYSKSDAPPVAAGPPGPGRPARGPHRLLRRWVGLRPRRRAPRPVHHVVGEHAGAGRPRRLRPHRANRPEPGGGRGPDPRLRPQQREPHGRRDRPGHVQGHRPLRRRPGAPAHHPVVGPQDPLRRQQRGELPHADRPGDGQARPADPGRRPLQPLLHPRRRPRHRRGRGAAPARRARPPHLGRGEEHPGALRRRRPRRLHRRREADAAASSPASCSAST